jgi:hypothetical protein
MKNVYYVGSGELTFELIERIINENLKLELAPGRLVQWWYGAHNPASAVFQILA